MARKSLLHILPVILFLSTSPRLNAQLEQDSITFHHIEKGMSESTASVIFEDSYGFIWTGTPNGLNRFDGTDFKVFEKSLDGKTGLTDGYVITLYEDNETLYIGTNQGLSVYDRDLDIVRAYEFKNEGKAIATRSFRTILRDGDILWLGTFGNGLYRYNTKTGGLKQFLVDEIISVGNTNRNLILQVARLDGEGVLVITNSALFVLTNNLEIVTEQLEHVTITCATKIDNHNFLLGTQNGDVIELHVTSDAAFHFKRSAISPGYVILSLAKRDNGDIWVGTENNGLFIHSKATGDMAHIKSSASRTNTISSNSIWYLMNASNGVMWMAPFKKGLSFYDPQYYKFKHIKQDPFNPKSLNNNIINCFTEDEKGNLWVGTDGGGLNYWNRSLNTFEHYSLDKGNFSSNVVLSLLQTETNQLWVGTWANGLTIYNTEDGSYETLTAENSFLSSNNITGLIQDRKGRIWIVNLFGAVHVYNPVTKTAKTVSITSAVDGANILTVARILEDKNGNIWLGSQSAGLFRLVENEKGWTRHHYHSQHESKAISTNFINTIFEDDEGTLWVGTQAGLNKYLPDTDSFEAITKQDGLKNDAIMGIIADDEKQLWLSTGGGILRYNPETGDTIAYDEGDGLQSNEFNASSFYTTGNGEYVFGGSNGFNIFTPDEVAKRNDKPKVFIAGIKIFNRPVSPNDETGVLNKTIARLDSVTFNYDHSVINFDFRALTFRHPEKVNYAYFLEGFEKEWNYVGNTPQTTYTNLSPGNYTLRIKSSNSDGVWNTEETKLAVSVTPPFWQTWWFRFLIGAMLLGGIYTIYFVRIQNIKRYQLKLERRIDERTKELQLQKKKLAKTAKELSEKNEEIQRFTYAVSHDLKSPLHSIEVLTSLIPNDIDITKYPDTAEYLDFIEQSCTIMKNLIEDITEIAKLGKIENKNELLDTKEIIKVASNMAFGRFSENKGELIISHELPPIYGDRNRLIQVFENLIDNAIKYMGDQKSPIVRVTSKTNKDHLQFFVIDNGSGMDTNAQQKLFTPFQRFDSNTEGTGLGLYMIKKIIESHEGTISARSEGKGKGTTFVITLPKAKAA